MTTPAPPVYNARYELREQIGRGGTAQVFLARDLLLDRPVALKVLMSELSHDHSFVERFRREAQAAANLTHPNIVSVFDWGESEDTYYIVMEYIDGESLASIIRTQAPIPPVQAASIAADIANALSYAHRHGVVHRDVKPGNVLITADGQVKVTDFGIARAVGADDQITQTGLVMGTATYFSPEQAQGLGVDGRSDVYALGVVLYEMVVGRPPFHGENPVSIAYQHVREDPPTPRSLNPAVPLALEAIVLQAIAKVPGDRYATAEELRADLGRFVHGQPVHARPPSGPTGDMTEAVRAAPAIGATAAAPSVAAEEAPAPGRTTGRWVAAGVLLLVGIVLIGLFVGRDLGYFGGGTFVKVPDVYNKTTAAARAELRAHGLRVDPVAGAASATQTGRVYKMVPDPHSTVRRGSMVTIDYYRAPSTVVVPTVTRLSAASAESKLRAAHLIPVTKYKAATTPDEVQGSVIGQVPAAGRSATRGSNVTIDVVRGKTLVPVPNVAGQNEASAGAAIQAAGLSVGTIITGGYSATVAAGDVVTTNPPINMKVPPGSTVDLRVSRGTGVVIPDMVGDSLQSAQQAMVQAKMTSVATTTCDYDVSPSQVNIVVSQTPMYVPARLVSPSHTVTLYVGCPSTSTTAPTGSTPTGSTPTGSSGAVP